jgi:hypothetical protein
MATLRMQVGGVVQELGGPAGPPGPSGPAGSQRLISAKSTAGYTAVTKDGTYVDVPGMSMIIPAGQAYNLRFIGYLSVRIDTGIVLGDAAVNVRLVDAAVTTNYGLDTHRFYVPTAITAGTLAFNNKTLYFERDWPALAAPLTVKMQMSCSANLTAAVVLASSATNNYATLAMVADAI